MKNPDLQVAVDARLSEAVEAARYRTTLNMQKKNALLKLQRDLTLALNGGTFTASQELISFLSSLLWAGKTDVVLLDSNDNPIDIADLETFFEKVTDTYYEAMNEYLVTIKGINKLRTTKALVGEL